MTLLGAIREPQEKETLVESLDQRLRVQGQERFVSTAFTRLFTEHLSFVTLGLVGVRNKQPEVLFTRMVGKKPAITPQVWQVQERQLSVLEERTS